METRLISHIGDVNAAAWNALLPDGDYPFLRHEFLHALEASGCVSRRKGWQALHLLIEHENQLVGAVPLYLKFHSFGEFVFDWSWADAYQRAGLNYYPKMLNAVPFTPATGPRLLVSKAALRDHAARAVRELATQSNLSSAHVLFANREDAKAFSRAGFLIRQDCQYHWFNRGYDTFDGFLQSLNAKRRKEIRRERRRVREAGISIAPYRADELSPGDWRLIFQFYASTYHMRGQEPYLNLDFFMRIREAMPENLVVFLAQNVAGEPVATAITLRGERTLYGRHWGANADYHSLHFEACYYQGIDYCIANGLEKFDAGAQGEHKINRGFVPVTTYSHHWICEPRFRAAIEDFLARETILMDNHVAYQQTREPFRHEDGGK